MIPPAALRLPRLLAVNGFGHGFRGLPSRSPLPAEEERGLREGFERAVVGLRKRIARNRTEPKAGIASTVAAHLAVHPQPHRSKEEDTCCSRTGTPSSMVQEETSAVRLPALCA